MEPTYQYKAIVERVVDGDTIDLDIDIGFSIHIRERVRLFGIDTPETRTKNLIEKLHGIEAKNYVKDAIEGKEIVIETIKEKKGKFGRYLAVIHYKRNRHTTNLNKELVDKKMAKRYYGGKK